MNSPMPQNEDNLKEALIKKYQDKLGEHPAMKYVNDVITIHAIRSGTKGYDGGENLNDFIAKMVNEILDTLVERIEGMKLDCACRVLVTSCAKKHHWNGAIDKAVALIKEGEK